MTKLRESEVVAKLENVSLLIINGSGDHIVGLEEAKKNYEVTREAKELLIIESANHAFQRKEEETIDKTIVWLRGQIRR